MIPSLLLHLGLVPIATSRGWMAHFPFSPRARWWLGNEDAAMTAICLHTGEFPGWGEA